MSMTFIDAVKHVLANYANFNGRATRSEYWWYSLFTMLLQIAFIVFTVVLGDIFSIMSALIMLALALPTIAVTARRLHDIDRSGWWMLVAFVPLVGFIVLIIFTVRAGTPGSNRFGDPHPTDATQSSTAINLKESNLTKF